MDTIKIVVNDDGAALQLQKYENDLKYSNPFHWMGHTFVPGDDVEREFGSPLFVNDNTNNGNAPLMVSVMTECRNKFTSSLPDYAVIAQPVFNYNKRGRPHSENIVDIVASVSTINYDLYVDFDMAKIKPSQIHETIGIYLGTVAAKRGLVYYPPRRSGQTHVLPEFMATHETLDIATSGHQRLVNSWCLPHIPNELRCVDHNAIGRALWLVVKRVQDDMLDSVVKTIERLLEDGKELHKKQKLESVTTATAATTTTTASTTTTATESKYSAPPAQMPLPPSPSDAEIEELVRADLVNSKGTNQFKPKWPYPTPQTVTAPQPPPPPPQPQLKTGTKRRRRQDDEKKDEKDAVTDVELIEQRQHTVKDGHVSVAVRKLVALMKERPGLALDKAIGIVLSRKRRPQNSFWRILPWVTRSPNSPPEVPGMAGKPIFIGRVTSVEPCSTQQIAAVQTHTFPTTAEWLDQATLLPFLTVLK